MTIDPVCKMEVNQATSLSAEHQGTTYFFCSEHCKQAFLKNGAAHLHVQSE